MHVRLRAVRPDEENADVRPARFSLRRFSPLSRLADASVTRRAATKSTSSTNRCSVRRRGGTTRSAIPEAGRVLPDQRSARHDRRILATAISIVQPGGRAIRYGIGVTRRPSAGRECSTFRASRNGRTGARRRDDPNASPIRALHGRRSPIRWARAPCISRRDRPIAFTAPTSRDDWLRRVVGLLPSHVTSDVADLDRVNVGTKVIIRQTPASDRPQGSSPRKRNWRWLQPSRVAAPSLASARAGDFEARSGSANWSAASMETRPVSARSRTTRASGPVFDVDFPVAPSPPRSSTIRKGEVRSAVGREPLRRAEEGRRRPLSRNSTWTMEPRGRAGPEIRSHHLLRRPGSSCRARRTLSPLDLADVKICVQTGTTNRDNGMDFLGTNNVRSTTSSKVANVAEMVDAYPGDAATTLSDRRFANFLQQSTNATIITSAG